MDIREAVEEFQYAKLRLSRHPQRGYRNRLTVFVAWCEQQELTLETIIARHIRTFIEEMNTMKSALVVLALLASLVGSYLIGVSAPQVQSAPPVLHQPALHQLLATGGGSNPGGP